MTFTTTLLVLRHVRVCVSLKDYRPTRTPSAHVPLSLTRRAREVQDLLQRRMFRKRSSGADSGERAPPIALQRMDVVPRKPHLARLLRNIETRQDESQMAG